MIGPASAARDALSNAEASAAAATPQLTALSRSITPRAVIVSLLLLGFAFLLNWLLNAGIRRALERQARHGGVPAETRTRMLIIRRIATAGIWLFAIGVALGQFNELKVLSTSLLAAGGVSGLVVGFAAQNMLGNAVAGVIIAFSQPIRIGDDVEFRTERGTVEDMTLFFTVLKLIDGKRMIVPNNTLANEVVKNLTMGDVTRVCRVEVLVQPRASAEATRQALLAAANGFPGLDRDAADKPEVYWIRIDERGTLLRLQATCVDGAASNKLGQLAFAKAASVALPLG